MATNMSLVSRRIADVFTHTQAVPASVWSITHNLQNYPIVDVYVDVGGTIEKIIPMSVTYVTANACEVEFSAPVAGFATIV